MTNQSHVSTQLASVPNKKEFMKVIDRQARLWDLLNTAKIRAIANLSHTLSFIYVRISSCQFHTLSQPRLPLDYR